MPPALLQRLSIVAFIEGKPQRPHRRLVVLSGRLLFLHDSALDSVMEQVPGRSRNWSRVSDV